MEQNQPLKVIKGGNNPGIWGVEILAIRDAAWIKPEFEIDVYDIFREAVLNNIDAMTQLNRLDLRIDHETKEISHCARTMANWGVGGRKELLISARNRLVSQIQMLIPGMNNDE